MRKTCIAAALASALLLGASAAAFPLIPNPAGNHFTILGQTICVGDTPAPLVCDLHFMTPEQRAEQEQVERPFYARWLDQLRQGLETSFQVAKSSAGTSYQ